MIVDIEIVHGKSKRATRMSLIQLGNNPIHEFVKNKKSYTPTTPQLLPPHWILFISRDCNQDTHLFTSIVDTSLVTSQLAHNLPKFTVGCFKFEPAFININDVVGLDTKDSLWILRISLHLPLLKVDF